jgi:uncharacterized GH25 family protein
MHTTLKAATVLMVLLLAMTARCAAHDMWVAVSSHRVSPGESITITVKEGHEFPEGKEVAASKIARLALISPDGSVMDLPVAEDPGSRALKPTTAVLKKAGTYTVVAEKKSYFVTKTTTGTVFEQKNRVKKALSSKYSEYLGKAIVTAGKSSGSSFQRAFARFFQLTPLQDPGLLHAGQSLGLVVACGNTGCEAGIRATYEGYRADTHEHGGHDHHHASPVESRSAKDGKAVITLPRKGKWLVIASREMPYRDPAAADHHVQTGTITFELP